MMEVQKVLFIGSTITATVKEPSLVLFDFYSLNDEQKPGGILPVPMSVNYEINPNSKEWFDGDTVRFKDDPGDFENMLAWVNDDYGDGQFSLEAFDGEIPDEQRQIARKARETINSQIGPYSDYYKALVAKHPDPDIIVKARNLASRALQIQWIDGDVDTAERSFFNINQQATPIDPTELKLLQKRKIQIALQHDLLCEQEKGINIGTIFHRKFRRVLKHSQVQLTDCYLIR